MNTLIDIHVPKDIRQLLKNEKYSHAPSSFDKLYLNEKTEKHLSETIGSLETVALMQEMFSRKIFDNLTLQLENNSKVHFRMVDDNGIYVTAQFCVMNNSVDVAVAMKFNNGKIELGYLYANENFITHYSKESETVIIGFLVQKYFIVSYLMLNRATVLHEKTVQLPHKKHTKKGKKKKQPVKLVRNITVIPEKLEKCLEEAKKVHHEITCPCWGVVGHWRFYKSGKKVWIEHYRKGKHRNDPSAYVPKQYVLPEEETT